MQNDRFDEDNIDSYPDPPCSSENVHQLQTFVETVILPETSILGKKKDPSSKTIGQLERFIRLLHKRVRL